MNKTRLAALLGIPALTAGALLAATVPSASALPLLGLGGCQKVYVAVQGDTLEKIANKPANAALKLSAGSLAQLNAGLGVNLGILNPAPNAELKAGTKVCLLKK